MDHTQILPDSPNLIHIDKYVHNAIITLIRLRTEICTEVIEMDELLKCTDGQFLEKVGSQFGAGMRRVLSHPIATFYPNDSRGARDTKPARLPVYHLEPGFCICSTAYRESAGTQSRLELWLTRDGKWLMFSYRCHKNSGKIRKEVFLGNRQFFIAELAEEMLLTAKTSSIVPGMNDWKVLEQLELIGRKAILEGLESATREELKKRQSVVTHLQHIHESAHIMLSELEREDVVGKEALLGRFMTLWSRIYNGFFTGTVDIQTPQLIDIFANAGDPRWVAPPDVRVDEIIRGINNTLPQLIAEGRLDYEMLIKELSKHTGSLG